MFGVVIPPVNFGRGLFSYSNFIFFYINDKEETETNIFFSNVVLNISQC